MSVDRDIRFGPPLPTTEEMAAAMEPYVEKLKEKHTMPDTRDYCHVCEQQIAERDRRITELLDANNRYQQELRNMRFDRDMVQAKYDRAMTEWANQSVKTIDKADVIAKMCREAGAEGPEGARVTDLVRSLIDVLTKAKADLAEARSVLAEEQQICRVNPDAHMKLQRELDKGRRQYAELERANAELRRQRDAMRADIDAAWTAHNKIIVEKAGALSDMQTIREMCAAVIAPSTFEFATDAKEMVGAAFRHISEKRSADAAARNLEFDRMQEEFIQVRAELKSTGHRFDPAMPLHEQVDRAIDSERVRHHESLERIAKALGQDWSASTEPRKDFIGWSCHLVNAIRQDFVRNAKGTVIQRLSALEHGMEVLRQNAGLSADDMIPF